MSACVKHSSVATAIMTYYFELLVTEERDTQSRPSAPGDSYASPLCVGHALG